MLDCCNRSLSLLFCNELVSWIDILLLVQMAESRVIMTPP